MDWTQILQDIFTVVLIPLLGALTIYAVSLIKVKAAELKEKTKSETAKKYIDMLDKTITECVIATNQTYVDALKEQGAFDAEAQNVAFQKTFDAVMKILTDDAKKYLNESVADLTEYITNRIEFEVAIDKM